MFFFQKEQETPRLTSSTTTTPPPPSTREAKQKAEIHLQVCFWLRAARNQKRKVFFYVRAFT